MDLGRAISITAKAFENRVDKGGKPYILHCLHVMNTCGSVDEEVLAAAVMHDLVEDTAWRIQDLRAEGFSEKTLKLVEYLTHVDGMSYDDYIKTVASNEDATKIKKADLRHNSDITRMKGLRKKDFDRLEKYHRAYMYLGG